MTILPPPKISKNEVLHDTLCGLVENLKFSWIQDGRQIQPGFKKMPRGDSGGLLDLKSRHTQVSFMKKWAFLKFFPGSLYKFSNALALFCV